jgi:predicted dehydrogenase
MANQEEISRRELLGKASALAAGGLAAPYMATLGAPSRTQSPSANDKVVFGLIGCGGMGASNMRSFMEHPDVEFAALCDVDQERIPGDFKTVSDKYGKKPDVYRDYRKMLERKDIDAVIIGTPDHWHALNLIDACEAGKDLYCEKPISHNIVEAISMAACAKKHRRVVQVGTWQRSTPEFTDAIDYIRKGKLGKVVLCRAWITDTFRAGKQKPAPVPTNLDYDFWVGPAKMEPYQQNRCHWNWRWFMNYGGGMSTDWGVHMMDIALLGMSKDQDLVMPISVSASGGQFAILDDDRTAPDTTEAVYRFQNPDFVMHWSIGRDHPGKPGHGTEFVAADGKTLRVWRGGWTVLDAEGKELPKESADRVGDHWRNFLDCVKTREKPRADLSSVAQTTIVCHLANCALYSGQTVAWDNKRMDISGRAGRNTLAYQREYRRPWSLKKYR